MDTKFVVIEGLDGSGKETQTKLLVEHMHSLGIKSEYISFPNYNSKSSEFVKMYLSGELSKNPAEVNAYAASTFFACDRYITYMNDKRKFRDKNQFLVCDRYTTSNKIYQMAKLQKNEWNIYSNWLEDFEYNKLELPKPDLIIYLKIPLRFSLQLLEKRYSNNGKKRDIHEKDVSFLSSCFEVADYVSEKENWTIIDCMESEDKIHSVSFISQKIRNCIGEFFDIVL